MFPQSVPILGYLSFTVVFFVSLFPGNQLSLDLAAIFAVFTSQAWNMAFSFYQSLRTIPSELGEACRSFRASPWQRCAGCGTVVWANAGAVRPASILKSMMLLVRRAR